VKLHSLGRTGLDVSTLSFGASALGAMFRPVDEARAVLAVHAALDLGINYFDVAPAYGGTRSEVVLGKALKRTPRSSYVLSTKVGKYTGSEADGEDVFDYSRSRIRRSFEDSATRLGTDFIDLVHVHDFDLQDRRHTEWALTEGLEAVMELKREGRVGAVGLGIYAMDLWHRVLAAVPLEVGLVHNHYSLHDTRLLELLPIARQRGVGLINASPFGSGLLTGRAAPGWHPASAAERELFRQATDYCATEGTTIAKVAIQFASQHPEVSTTLFSSADPDSVRRTVEWAAEPFDPALVDGVRAILRPVLDKDWF
jgi:L-galactose dehydrogenase